VVLQGDREAVTPHNKVNMKRVYHLLLPIIVGGCGATIAHSVPQTTNQAPAQSIGLPWERTPTYCVTPSSPSAPPITSCSFYTFAGSTLVAIVHPGPPTIVDSQGNIWTKRFSFPFTSDAIYDTQITQQNPDTITFANLSPYPENQGNFIIVLMYKGLWNYVGSQFGSYAGQNSPFSDCTNGNNCPYDWTMPIEADAGDLLIGFSNPEGSGLGVPKPGFGYQIEFSNGLVAVEDMIAPIEGPYIGAMTWKDANGSDSGGTHWVMGLVQYRR